MSVADSAPVAPVYVVPIANEPCAEKLPVGPNAKFRPAISSIAELTAVPVTKPAPVPLMAYCTLAVDPSTTEYAELASVDAVHPVGAGSTETPLIVSVVTCPSGAVTTTANVTGPEAGAVYVLRETECVALV
jgi:hypothetical protein